MSFLICQFHRYWEKKNCKWIGLLLNIALGDKKISNSWMGKFCLEPIRLQDMFHSVHLSTKKKLTPLFVQHVITCHLIITHLQSCNHIFVFIFHKQLHHCEILLASFFICFVFNRQSFLNKIPPFVVLSLLTLWSWCQYLKIATSNVTLNKW